MSGKVGLDLHQTAFENCLTYCQLLVILAYNTDGGKIK